MPLRLHVIQPPGKALQAARPFLIFAVFSQLGIETITGLVLKQTFYTMLLLLVTFFGCLALRRVHTEWILCFGLAGSILFIADIAMLFGFIWHEKLPFFMTNKKYNAVQFSLAQLILWLKPVSDGATIISMVRAFLTCSEPHQIIELHPGGANPERHMYGSFTPFQGKPQMIDSAE